MQGASSRTDPAEEIQHNQGIVKYEKRDIQKLQSFHRSHTFDETPQKPTEAKEFVASRSTERKPCYEFRHCGVNPLLIGFRVQTEVEHHGNAFTRILI